MSMGPEQVDGDRVHPRTVVENANHSMSVPGHPPAPSASQLTGNKQVNSRLFTERNPLSARTSGDTATALAQVLADPDLQRLVTAWPTLPDQFKAAVLALLATAPGV
jgi:hypothetical protein